MKDSYLLNINQVVINSANFVKLLGVEIDSKFSFEKHIYTLSEKASNQLNAISRIQTFISFKETLITVHLYDIFCSAESLNKIEKMHEKALRKLYNDFCDYEAILNKSAKPTMKVKHLTNLALGIFRTQGSINKNFCHT